MLGKNAISPIISITLLLIVAVLAVIGFQNWYGTYSSNLFTSAEIKSAVNSGTPKIENMIGKVIYIKNPNNNLTIKSVKLDVTDCLISEQTYTNSLINITIPDFCYYNSTTSTPSVVVVTQNQIFEHKVFLKDIGESPSSTPSGLDCSGLIGGEWVLVPSNGLGSLVSQPFCVMKYEAKEDTSGLCPSGNSINCPISTETYNPWTSINWYDAKEECESLGLGFYLINNNQWITIARIIETNSNNWDSGIVNSGSLSRGWSANNGINDLWTNTGFAPFTNSSCLYNSGSNICSSTGDFLYKRTYNLDGQSIWDLGGNILEWVSDSLNTTGLVNSSLGKSTSGWKEWDDISGYLNLKPFNTNLNSTNNIGQVYTDINSADPSGDIHALIRSGNWDHSDLGGIYGMSLDYGPAAVDSALGFRCVYSP